MANIGITENWVQNKRITALEKGGGGASLTVETKSQTPTVADVTTIKVTDGTLTQDAPGVVTIDTSGIGGGGMNGFSPLCIGAATGPSSTSETKLYLTEAECDMTITDCTVWGSMDAGEDGEIFIGVYRWNTGWGNGALMGKVENDPLVNPAVYGPNNFSFVVEEGQNMEVTAGEWLIVAMGTVSGDFDPAGRGGFGDRMFSQASSDPASSVGLPETTPAVDDEGWNLNEDRFCITLWEIEI